MMLTLKIPNSAIINRWQNLILQMHSAAQLCTKCVRPYACTCTHSNMHTHVRVESKIILTEIMKYQILRNIGKFKRKISRVVPAHRDLTTYINMHATHLYTWKYLEGNRLKWVSNCSRNSGLHIASSLRLSIKRLYTSFLTS